ncbi:hypothetical protein EGW08_005694 [Elysia chlorotica]|uniref:Secreted protein n=1 Tax=Elysia chlorotica TaxID=188477 RepID=A0A3S1AA59_ELYCH|nr:hypothetical protein EGW08_005694 [Elysia chlorotica]
MLRHWAMLLLTLKFISARPHMSSGSGFVWNTTTNGNVITTKKMAALNIIIVNDLSFRRCFRRICKVCWLSGWWAPCLDGRASSMDGLVSPSSSPASVRCWKLLLLNISIRAFWARHSP